MARVILLGAAVAIICTRWFVEASLARTIMYLAVAIATTVVLLVSSKRESSFRRAWRWIALSMGCWACGDITWYAIDAAGGVTYPSAADIFYLSGYAAFITGLVTIAVANRPTRERAIDLIDVTIVCLSAGLLLWPFVIEPTVAAGWTTSTLDSLAYTGGDVLLLGLLAALWFTSQKRTTSVSMMAAAAAGIFIADNLSYIPSFTGPLAGNVADTLWLVGYVLIATAALSRRDDRAAGDLVERPPLRRMIFVGFALFAIPGVLLLDGVLGDGLEGDDWKVFFVVFVAVIALVVLRGTVMLSAVVRSRERAYAARLRLATIVDAAGVGIVIQGTALMTETNKGFQEMLGYTRDELAAMSYLDVVHPEEAEAAESHLALGGGSRETFLRRLVRRDGEIVEAQITLTVAPDNEFRIAVIEDITDRLALERQLADAHKLEAVGRLAGGIAHDFNNLLTAVSGYAELIRYSNERSEKDVRAEIDESVDVIVDAAGRGADLTQQLLTFSRRHTFALQEIDTPELLARTEQLLRRVIGSMVMLETRIDPGAPPIFADPSQMDQVLLNLAINARDAMPDGGTLTLTLGHWTPSEWDSPRYAAIPPGEYCRITVADTGFGMAPSTLERIFEPFFTTKDVGKGTGLGLATSYGIVTSIDGHLLVSSKPGQGTEFEIILPAAAVEQDLADASFDATERPDALVAPA